MRHVLIFVLFWEEELAYFICIVILSDLFKKLYEKSSCKIKDLSFLIRFKN